MRRLFLILRREYLAYLLTPGFLLALVTFPLIFAASVFLPTLLSRQAPAPQLIVLDLTGIGPQGPGAYVAAQIREGRARNLPQGLAPVLVQTPASLSTAQTPDAAGRAVQAYYKAFGQDPPPPAVLVLAGSAQALDARLWTPRARLLDLSGQLEDSLTDWSRESRLRSLGLSSEAIRAVSGSGVSITAYSPASRTGKVTLTDRLPHLAALGVSYLLVTMILAGSGMILTSVVEERSSRVIEVLVTSAHPAELLLGKVLGILCLFFTGLGALAVAALLIAGQLPQGAVQESVRAVLNGGLLGWAAFFLAFGFLLYGSIFAGLAAFCETPREAQSLATPLSMLMLIPLLLVISGLQAPDSPILRAAALFPPFTPFLMLLRIADGAPAWELATGISLMALTTAGAIWVGVQAYRTGALTQGSANLWSILRRSLQRQG
ncbi:MAG: ABC transporter permease [Phenylobacterium sp.]|uniref:ABC transporter permease n=1 Tax=Phenylobacterium sp. TaxID=1871053 RepID=UPI0025CC1212|nr:ABC transporter permease [Phenylobacterium sp.]MCA3756489.1 ABC transporter permease [Phenylobacterium sp.]